MVIKKREIRQQQVIEAQDKTLMRPGIGGESKG